MQELSMNVLDIAQNSVVANASLIEISVLIDNAAKKMTITIADNGKGMSEEMVQKVTDPFCTSRTTRKVGLGLPFFKMAAEQTGGTMHISSQEGVGTGVIAEFCLGHIDLAPLGDMTGTIVSLIQCNPNINFVYTTKSDVGQFICDTRDLKEILGDVSLAEPTIALWVQDYLNENTNEILKRSNAL